MTLPMALVRAVSSRVDHAELTFLDRTPVDLQRAVAQHQKYVDLLAELGHQVVHVAATDELPDGTFVEDTAVVVEDLAILARPGVASRRPELETMRAALAALGVRVAAVQPPATLDGGDVLQIGRSVFVGLSSRTNHDGVSQLRSLVAPFGRTVVPVPVHGCLHLKTGATALPDGTALVNPDVLDHSPFADAAIPVLHVPEPAGANVLLSGDRVILAASAPDTAALIQQRQYEVHTIDIGELEKLEAGLTCLSVFIPA
jgi:dimethylargininase